MCPETTCEDCLIKLRSKFKDVFGERHNLLNCCQHLQVSQEVCSTNVPILPWWIPLPAPAKPASPCRSRRAGSCMAPGHWDGLPTVTVSPTSGPSTGSPCPASPPKGLVQSPAARETASSNLWSPCFPQQKASTWCSEYYDIPVTFAIAFTCIIFGFWTSELVNSVRHACFKHLDNFHA